MEDCSWNMDFSYDYYRKILSLLRKNFHLCLFHESPNYIDKNLNKPVALLRHDVDLDIEKALKMAEIEASKGVYSCFMFLTNCYFYSLSDNSVISAIQSIKKMGHEVGLHYDIHNNNNNNNNESELIKMEISKIEDIISSKVCSISFHRPSPIYINGPTHVNGMVNTYASSLMNCYLSDSKGRWRNGEPIPMIRNNKNNILQLLVHPIWWGKNHIPASERLQEFFNKKTIGMSNRDVDILDNELSKHLTLARSGRLNKK